MRLQHNAKKHSIENRLTFQLHTPVEWKTSRAQLAANFNAAVMAELAARALEILRTRRSSAVAVAAIGVRQALRREFARRAERRRRRRCERNERSCFAAAAVDKPAAAANVDEDDEAKNETSCQNSLATAATAAVAAAAAAAVDATTNADQEIDEPPTMHQDAQHTRVTKFIARARALVSREHEHERARAQLQRCCSARRRRQRRRRSAARVRVRAACSYANSERRAASTASHRRLYTRSRARARAIACQSTAAYAKFAPLKVDAALACERLSNSRFILRVLSLSCTRKKNRKAKQNDYKHFSHVFEI